MATRSYSSLPASASTDESLYDGVPPWLANSLRQWFEQFLTYKPAHINGRRANDSLILSIERRLRIQITPVGTRDSLLYGLFTYMGSSGQRKLDVAQAVIELGDYLAPTATADLDALLVEAGSKWRAIYDEKSRSGRLEERVDVAASDALDDAVAAGGKAADYLVSAWGHAFGRTPNSSSAYGDAIKAIEAAMWPVVSPNDQKATLGKMLGVLRAAPASWTTAISEQNSNAGIEATIATLSLIWEGQTDRHGTANPTKPSQNAAEQAVLLAVAQCQLFRRGLIVTVS